MSENLYPQVVRFVRDQPWALMPDVLATMLDVIRFRNNGGHLTEREIRERIPEHGAKRGPDCRLWADAEIGLLHPGEPLSAATRGRRDASVVAVLGVYGMITKRADMFSDMSGGTSIERLTRRFREALADPAVSGIVMDVDSPGGGTYGLQEFGNEIRSGRGQKPIVAVANSLMASAAYWIGSQAEEILVSPSSETGSIGVYGAHEDFSAMLEKEGVKVTLLSYGENKTLANPYEPLSDDGRDALQKRVDEMGAMFDRAVAKGRSVSVDDVRSSFGQGLVFGAKEAVERGLADRLGTLEDAIRTVARQNTKSQKAAEGLSPAVEAELQAAQARARSL